MNIYPNPLLCLYCDSKIVPPDVVGCRKHMLRCYKHPAGPLIGALNRIRMLLSKTRSENPSIEEIDKIAEDALR